MGGGKHAPSAVEIPLVHVQQRLTWDCGVSAVMMVLNESDRTYMRENLDIVSQEEGFNKSTWTIDLAYLLHKFGIRHHYVTITLGVNPGYSLEDFYQQVLKKDANRINERFQLAAVNGISIEKRAVELEEIIDHLSLGNPAILLVNANLLFCDACHSNKCLMQLLSCCNMMLSYQGHYIVLCGFNDMEKKVLYRNPTFMNRVCTMPYDAFEAARKSFGTDEDVLFVYLNS